jgi:ketosteroid isomerase-like protein
MPTAIEQDVLRQEQRLIEASRALDLETLDSIYADDLLLSGVMGEPTCGKAAVLDEVRRGIVEREQAHASQSQVSVSAQNEDMQVVAHGDTVIANYRSW